MSKYLGKFVTLGTVFVIVIPWIVCLYVELINELSPVEVRKPTAITIIKLFYHLTLVTKA